MQFWFQPVSNHDHSLRPRLDDEGDGEVAQPAAHQPGPLYYATQQILR